MATKKQGTSLARTTAAPARRAKTSEVVEVAEVIYDVPTINQVKEAIQNRSKLFFDGDESGDSILIGTLAKAKDGFDLFAESELEKVEDHLGETLTITAVNAVRNSEFEGGLGVYLIVTAVDVDGGEFRLAVGQTDPIAKIVSLSEMGQLPWAVCFERSSKPTRAGFYPINLLSRQMRDGSQPF